MSPDYSDATKFADDWLAPHPGTDGALAMAMGHVVLKEFFVDRQVPALQEYVKRYSDLPFLLTLTPRGDGYVPGKFLTAADLGDLEEGAEFKTVLVDSATGEPHVPNGSLGFRFGEAGKGKWNLDLGDVDPLLSLHGRRRRVGDRRPRPLRHRPRRGRHHAPRRPGPPGRQAPGDHGVRPAARPVRRRPRRPAGRVAGRPGRRLAALHPGLAGAVHRRERCGRGADRPGVRAERRRVPRPLHDHHGCRDQPLVPLRHDLPRVPDPDHAHRLPGRERRRLGALRRPGEVPPDHRLDRRSPRRWTGPARRGR